MRFHQNSLARGIALAGVAATLVACGGGSGGGSTGGVTGAPTPANQYEISIRADRASLPLNIANMPPGIGIDAPYTTTVYVEARRKNTGDPIPGGADVFACNMEAGVDSGALYYLDGDPEHETEVDLPDGSKIRVPTAYSSITLGANSGGARFHFHAEAKAGTAEIRCSVFDPQSGQNESGAVSISVGEMTGVASQIKVNASGPGYLFAQMIGGDTQLMLQAQVLDDTGQWAPNPPAGVRNLYARIVPTGSMADDDAKLRGTGQADNTWIKTRSIDGQAQFTVISGLETGPVLLEVVGDRADNNVDNGIQQAIANYYRVDVVDGSVFQAPLVPPTIVESGTLDAGKQGEPYEPVILQVTDGMPPYSWSLAQGSLPSGMTLRSYGVIDGTPLTAGSFSFVVRVRDSNGLTAEAVYGLRVEAAEPEPEPEIAELTIDGTSALASATVGVEYAQVFSATGGSEGLTYQWSASFRRGGATVSSSELGLAMSAAGGLEGTPKIAGDYVVEVTVRRGTSVANRAFTLRVNP